MTTKVPVLDAALEGFRLTREHPLAVAVWALLILLLNILSLGGLVAMGAGPALTHMGAVPLGSPDPADAAALQQSGVWLPLLALVQIVGGAVLYSAVMRAVTSPGDKAFAFLRLGLQEARQIALWVLGFVLLVFYTSVLLAGFQVAAMTDASGGKLIAAVAAVVVFLALFYPLVRLSLAPAATFMDRRIVLFGAWRLTRGEFWSLVGCYVTALMLAVAVWLLAEVVVSILVYVAAEATGAGPGLERSFDQLNVSSLQAFLAPVALGALAVRAMMMAPILLILIAPAPVICRALSERSGPER